MKKMLNNSIIGGDIINSYISLINNAVDYIERSIDENIHLTDLSLLSGISSFHFSRIFKTVVGISPKQYLLGRKLTKAASQLKMTDNSILETGLNFGFDYPEVFSRAFKKQFGISPLQYRNKNIPIKEINKATIVERDIINYRGALALKGNCIRLESTELAGVSLITNTNSLEFEQELKQNTETFILNSLSDSNFFTDKFFTIVTCSGKEDGEYTVFCGRKTKPIQNTNFEYKCFLIPEGWYADFVYSGDMFDIKEVFIEDLYKWNMVKDVEINMNGIGMLNIYENNYPTNNQVHILVPIKNPV